MNQINSLKNSILVNFFFGFLFIFSTDIFINTDLMADSASEFAKLIPSDADLSDEFGNSIAISDNIMMVGAPNEEAGGINRGAVYVYALTGNTWSYQNKLTASDGANYDNFGSSLSMSSNLVLIGATGHDSHSLSNAGAAYIFLNTSGNTWTEQIKLSSSDVRVGDFFGKSVAISGNLAIVGASWHDISGISNAGAAYIFANTTGNTWVEQSKLNSSLYNQNAYFGESVAINGNVALVGAYKDNSTLSTGGAVYAFYNSSGNIWNQETKIVASDLATNDQFGNALSLNGNTLLIGSSGDDVAGAAYVFSNTSGNIWAEQAKLTPSQGASQDDFGISVSLSGNMALIGSNGNDEIGTNTGTAYLFVSTNISTWIEQEKLVAGDGENDDFFGLSVGLSGNIGVVGAPQENSQGENSGAAYSFDFNNLTYAPVITPWPVLDIVFPTGQSSVNITSANISVSDQDGDNLTWTVSTLPEHGIINTFNTSANNIDSLIYQSDFIPGVGDKFELEVDDGTYSRRIIVSVGSENYDSDSLFSSDAQAYQQFGASVDTDGQYLIVGASRESSVASNSGAAYIYMRSGNNWVFQYKLKASDAEASDEFGSAVSISGNVAVVGAYQEDSFGNSSGAAYVFANTSGNIWVQQSKLISDQPGANYYFGKSLAISGNQIIVGSDHDANFGTNAGAVYIFANSSGNTWDLQRSFVADDASTYDYFGTYVDISGNLAVIGADRAGNGGAAYVFANTGGNTWVQQSKLDPEDLEDNDRFGTTVAISGNHVAVSSILEDSAGTEAGAVYIFANTSGSNWIKQGKIVASNAEANDNFGSALDISGTTVLVGVKYKDGPNGSNSGAAYLFIQSSANTWVEKNRLLNPSSSANDNFGGTVALSGNLALIGELYNDTMGSSAGVAHIFELGSISPYLSPNIQFSYSLDQNSFLTLDDTDISALSYYDTPLQWTLVGNGTFGEVTSLNTTGNNITDLVYVPNVDFTGRDSFILRVADTSAGSYRDMTIQLDVYPLPITLPLLKSFGASYRNVFTSDNTGHLIGGANDFGQLGNAQTSANTLGMMSITTGASTNQMAIGAEHVIARDDSGNVWTWGNNNYGQLGHGDLNLRSSPTQVPGLSDILNVYAGAYSSYAITEYGDLYAWGRNHHGQLGINSDNNQVTPQLVSLPGKIEDLSVGISHVLAIVSGNLYAWGNDGFDQLGDGPVILDLSLRDEPLLINDQEDWKRVVAGGFHSHAWTSSNTIYGWGKNLHGQLGVGHQDPVSSANTDTIGFSDLKNMSSGYDHTLFLKNDGSVWATGLNKYGQTVLGQDISDTPSEVQGINLNPSNEITTGPYSSLYLETSPLKIYIWGITPSGNSDIPTLYYNE